MMTDVGDAVELTFSTVTGATVTVDLYDPDDTLVASAAPVAESPASSGRYPYSFVTTSAGDWTARFTAAGAATAAETYRVRATDTLAQALTNPPFATVEDLQARPGGPYTATQLEQARTLLAEVTEEIRGLGGTWLPSAVPATIVGMACRAVARELNNPGRDIAETYAAYSHRVADGQVPATGLLTAADRATVTGLLGRPVGDVALNLVATDAAYTNRSVARRRYGRREPVGDDWAGYR